MNWEIFIPILIALISLIGKWLWDIYYENRRRKIELLEKRLSLFYYPILIRLEKDNATWRLILNKKQDGESLERRIGENIESQFILPNHDEIATIIEKNAYLCQDDKITDLLVKYIRHVAIYKAIRNSGDETTFPYDYDKSLIWPKDLFPKVSDKTMELQKQLDKLMWK